MNHQKCLPSKAQMDFLNWEFGVFLHFGIRTFYEGHRDWDMKPMPLEAFNPSELDCRQWLRVVSDAGARYAVLVTKHHDGFANWPSKVSEYTVKNTPWKNGNGDVVDEFTKACREFGIKIGLYYSPSEYALKEKRKTGREYDDYVIAQICELLTDYGDIDYLWFDGCGSEGHTYDSKRIVEHIRSLQPNILVFNMFDADVRWIGNEVGLAPSPCFNSVNFLDFSVQTMEKESLKAYKFLPGECDCRMRLDNWFYSDHDEETVKSLQELMGMYYYSIGRGTNLLINIGPDRRGLLPEKDANRLIEFGREIQDRFSKPIALMEDFMQQGMKFTCKMESPCLINHLTAGENLEMGESIKKFRIQVKPYSFGKPITVYEGYQVGNKAVCRFPAVFTSEVCFEILDYQNEPSIRLLNLYRVECLDE